MTASPKTAKTAKTVEVSAELISSYIALADGRNSSSWEFLAEALKYSVRVRKASIAQAQKDSGLSLPDFTPTKSQYLDTLALIERKFKVSQTMPFSKALSLASRADVTLKVEGARSLLKESKSLKAFEESVPKTTRKARPNEGKAEGAEFAGEVAEFETLTLEDILEGIVNLATNETAEERENIAKRLSAVAKLVRAMNTEVNA